MSNTVKSKGNIYNLAKLAKERLKQNNYTNTKTHTINNSLIFASYLSNKNTPQNVPKKTKTTITPPSTNYDEELYKKVCYLIETNNTVNPISYLIDKQLFATLDTEAKQFYINNLTKKYKFMKNRYYREHSQILYV